MDSVSLTRASMLDTLGQKYPAILWIDSRLPDYVYDATRTLGGVSTLNEIQQSNDFFVVRTILVQAFLPISLNSGGNIAIDKIPSSSDIELLATSIINDLSDKEASPDGSWFYRHIRTDYPNDPNGGQTRAAIQFAAYENSADLW